MDFVSESFRAAFFGGELTIPVAGLFALEFGCDVFFSFGSLTSEYNRIGEGLGWYAGNGGEEEGNGMGRVCKAALVIASFFGDGFFTR